MKKILMIVLIGVLFTGCSETKKEDHNTSNAPIIGDEKQVTPW